MKIIYLLLIVCLGLVTAKYLPNESASLTQLHRHLRSIEDDSAVSNEDTNEDSDNDDDTTEERTIQAQQQRIEERRQELSRKQEEQKRKQEEEQLKQQEKLEKEERKKQEKLEKEECKRQEKQEKEEKKRQERIEKENRKQEEADRKQQEKFEKKERKRQEKLRKQLEEIEKDTLESNKIPNDSSESLEANDSNESLDLEDIWRNHVYTKYGLSKNSTELERKAALNKYLDEELGINVNSTKSERRLAVIKLIQNSMNQNGTSQDTLRNYMLSHINAVDIQQLRVNLENKIAKLNNESELIENVTMPWVLEAKQTVDEKRTLFQSVLQFLSHLLPNWATGEHTPSSVNSNTNGSSQGHPESSANGSASIGTSNANGVLPFSSGETSSGAPEAGQAPASGSVVINSENNAVATTGVESPTAGSIDVVSNSVPSAPSASSAGSADSSQAGGIPSGIEGSTTSSDVSSTNIEASGNVAESPVDNLSYGSAAQGASDPTTDNFESTSNGGSPTAVTLPATGSSISVVEVPTADLINSSTSGSLASSDSSITKPTDVNFLSAQESVSIANWSDVTETGLGTSGSEISAPIDVTSIGSTSTGDNSVVTSVQESITGHNGPTQESSVPSGEAVPTTQPIDLVATGEEAPALSSIDGSSNGVSTSGNSGVVTGSIETGSPSAQQSTTGVNKPTPASFGLSEPVDISFSGTITPGEPATSSVDATSTGTNSLVTESVTSVSTGAQEQAISSTDAVLTSASDSVSGSTSSSSNMAPEQAASATDNLVALPESTVATENIDVASPGNVQLITNSVNITQISTESNVVVSSEGSNVSSIDANSTKAPEAGPIDVTSAAKVPAEDVTNVVTSVDTVSVDVLPNTSSPNVEETTGSNAVNTENLSNVSITDAPSTVTNVSISPTTISVSGVSETTYVDVAPTSAPDVIATDVTITPEMVSVANSVTNGYIEVETVAPTTEEVKEARTVPANVAPKDNSVPQGGASIFLFPNEPGASVVEITPQ